MKTCSTTYSKLLPIDDLIIDLTEDWEYHNCVISRIVLTQIEKVKDILVLPNFIVDFMKERL